MISELRRSFLYKKIIPVGVLAIVVIGLIIATPFLTQKKQSEIPEYNTLIPNGKSIDDFGGWQRISPPEKEPIFAYVDELDGVIIRVSQQPLPPQFNDGTGEHVDKLAKEFNATAQLEVGGVILYIGTNAKGPQTVIFTKNNLLVLITSQQKIEDQSWTRYISSLR